MRTFIAVLAVLSTASLLAASAEAASPRSKRVWKHADPKPFNSYGLIPGDAVGIRANAADPSGIYRGYPDWARAALGSGLR